MKLWTKRILVAPAAAFLLAACAAKPTASMNTATSLDRGPLLAAALKASPCGSSIEGLIRDAHDDPRVMSALDRAAAGMVDPPPNYGIKNPWHAPSGASLLAKMVPYFYEWCTFLPQIEGSYDNGLAFIQGFNWFFYRNPSAQAFVQGRDPADPTRPLTAGRDFLAAFRTQRGAFMDSPASRQHIAQWIANPRIEIKDYVRDKPEQYTSFNDFFAREMRVDPNTGAVESRPVTMPERDYVVSAPTDCIMNPLVQQITEGGQVIRRYVENPLQPGVILDIKGIPIDVAELLGSAPRAIKGHFVGGTGLSCILMPNTYHHFHAPVSGTVVHAELVKSGTFGYPDWPNWVPRSGNDGQPGTDFSQFQSFQRGVIIIRVEYTGLDGEILTGYVASIPVGLDTIGSVRLADDIQIGSRVERGKTRLGNFMYGGSLNILLFSRGLASGAVQTRMGNQISLLRAGKPPSAMSKQRLPSAPKQRSEPSSAPH